MGFYKEWVEHLEKNRAYCRGCQKYAPHLSYRKQLCVACECVKGVRMGSKKKVTKKKQAKKKA